MSSRFHFGLGTTILAALVGGCAVGAPADYDESAAASESDPIYANADLYWPNAGTGRVDINVCWDNPFNAPGATKGQKALWRDARRRAVEEAWGRNARINFYGWDGPDPVNAPRVCAANEKAIHIRICNATGDSACPAMPDSQSLAGYPGTYGVTAGVRLNPAHGASIAVREFGRALGFYYEEQRPGATAAMAGPCAQLAKSNSDPVSYGSYDSTGIMSFCQPPTAAPWLSANDIASVQRAYGRRIAGSIVSPRAHCVSAHHLSGVGTGAFTWDCDEANGDQKFVLSSAGTTGGHNLVSYDANGANPMCLSTKSITAGAQVINRSECSSVGSWSFEDVAVRGFGGMCMDVRDGKTTDGTPIQMWTCTPGNRNQQWSFTRSGQLAFADTSMCATVRSGRLVLATCAPQSLQQQFKLDRGMMRPLGLTSCLDAQGPSDAQFTSGQGKPGLGSPVQVTTCNASLNQQWNLNGPIRLTLDPTLCLNRKGTDSAGIELNLASCAANPSSTEWDYHF